MTISSKGKFAELIFKSTTLRLLLLLLLLLALEALVSTIGIALTSSARTNTTNSLILLKLLVFHCLLCELWWHLLGIALRNFLIVASENLSSAISKLSSTW